MTSSEESEYESEQEEEEVPQHTEVVASRTEDVVDDLNYDGYNLTASSYHPLRWSSDSKREKVILEATSRAAQLLFKKLMTFPTESSDVGPLTVLPHEIATLPRYTKIPEPKPETKWERFAREKGIKKEKKERMVYDEQTGEYKPRYGYKRINNGLEDLPIVEVKEGDDPFADPWSVDRQQKKDRIAKNKKSQMKNEARALSKTKGAKGGAKTYDPSSIPGIPVDMNEKKRGKDGVRKALQLAQHSTASMGRYDDKRAGEPERKIVGKKRSFRDNFVSNESEKAAMKSQIRFVTDKKQKKEKGVTNSLAAYEGILPDAPANSFKQAKGRGKNAGGDAKKKGKR